MMKKQFLLPMLLGVAGAFWACGPTESAGGPGSITTNGIAMADGQVAPFARVAVRAVDHMADDASVENSIIVADTVADSAGHFYLNVKEDGDYRLTILHKGYAYSKVMSLEKDPSVETSDLGSLNLVSTAVMTGEVDIPEGSNNVWVGILGTDILVPTDANGVFVIPYVPANDSLQLYFKSEDYDKVLDEKSVFFEPSESAYEDYRAPVESPKDEADSSVKKIVVLQSDGSVASNAKVALRKVDSMVGKFALQNNLVLADVVTDDEGKFTMEWPESGDYRLTVSLGSGTFSKVYGVDKLAEIDTLKLSSSATISSKVTLDSGEDYAWVGVYGFDVLVKTSDLGAYVLPTLPANDSLTLYFVHAKDSVPFVEQAVKTPKDGKSYLNPAKLLYDFEQDNEFWYMDVDTLYKGSTFKFGTGVSQNDKTHKLADHLEADEDRGNNVFHAYYELADNPYAWALLGGKFEVVKNFAAIDSIEFYAKGNGEVRLALENWESYSKGVKAASGWKKVGSDWSRIVVKPSELCVTSAEKWSCSDAWDSVKDQVKQIHFFFAAGNEIFIDDVKIYGALF